MKYKPYCIDWIKPIGLFILIAISLLLPQTLLAQSEPTAMLKTVSSNMISALKREQRLIVKDHKVLYRIVNQNLLPHVYVEGMARSVIGRRHWIAATQQQRSRFTQEFIQLVVRTYANALSSYNDQRVKFLPVRQSVQGRQRIQINSLIIQPRGGPSISVNYLLVALRGEWKIYDFTVNGISLVQSFRSQFVGVLSRQGFAGLIQQLVKHNQAA